MLRWCTTYRGIGCASVLLLAGTLVSAPHANKSPLSSADRIEVHGRAYSLHKAADLKRLVSDLRSGMAEDEARRATWESGPHRLSAGQPGEASQDRLREHFHPPAELWTSRERRGLRELLRRVESLPTSAESGREVGVREIQEIAAAVVNERRSAIPRLDMFTAPILMLDFLDRSIGGGERPASNVPVEDESDTSRSDPPASMFWTGERIIEQQRLDTGFGRTHLPDWSAGVWEYAAPKLSAGSNPGFEVRQGHLMAKVKFRETKSEPFTARMFHALGYYADVTDHVRGLRVRYDRRLLREFNLRQDVWLRFRVIGPPVAAVNLQRTFDLLDFVEAALLRDGTRLTREELRQRLFPSRESSGARLVREFDVEFEAAIDQLVLSPVNFQIQTDAWRSLGRWDYGELGHGDLREVRGAGLLAAWLGWFDCRFDNTSLRVRDRGGEPGELRAFFSDLGGGLGRTDGGFGWEPEDVESFAWEFTRPSVERGPGRMRTPFRVVRFHTITDNPAFQAMTEDDARWMARRIARLSREQIEAALKASGIVGAEGEQYLAKLISRRNRMLEDLGLDHEYPLLIVVDEVTAVRSDSQFAQRTLGLPSATPRRPTSEVIP